MGRLLSRRSLYQTAGRKAAPEEGRTFISYTVIREEKPMETNATYFVNDPERPLRYGKIGLVNPPRQRLRGEPMKECVLAVPVFCGFF